MMRDVMKMNGTKLIDARYQKGLNQTQVAEGADVSLYTIVKAEAGKDVYPATGKKICDFLGLDLATVVLPLEAEGNGDAA